MCLLLISHKMYIERVNQQKQKQKFFPGAEGVTPVFKSIKGLADQGLPGLLSFYKWNEIKTLAILIQIKNLKFRDMEEFSQDGAENASSGARL